MSNDSNYPEVEFIETDVETIENSMIASYELITGRVLYPADPMRVFIAWVADIIIQQRVLINDSAKQNVPRYAKGEYLDNLAEVFKDTYRLPAQASTATLRFYISEAQSNPVYIKEGTRVTVDGEIVFATEKTLEIKAGQSYGETRAKCLVAGEAGNGFKPGQIKEIIDVYDYYLKVENITESAGGASEEGDSDFYGRLRDSEESFSTAGPAASYVYHAKTASSLIVDVSPTSPEKGVVDVRVLLKDGELPNDEVLGLVKEALNSDKTRPMTEVVKVSAPGKVEFDIDITYFIPKPSASSADIISEEVKKAIKEYITWQTEKMGRDINPSKLISLIMQKGVKRVDIRSPVYKAVEKTFVASVLNNNVTNGGVEDE